MRFSIAPWSVSLEGLKPGDYEFRARTVDRNGFAQPEPRPFEQRSGVNGVQRKPLHIEAGIVRRFLRQFAGGFAQRRRIRQSAWYNSAAADLGRHIRPSPSGPSLTSQNS